MNTTILGYSPTASSGRRAADFIAALAPPPAGAAAVVKSDSMIHPKVKLAGLALIPSVVGAAAGAYVWKKHRILGGIAGMSVAPNVLRLIKSGERVKALCSIGATGVGVMGSLKWKRHPILGFVAGEVVGLVASAFVPGSDMNDAYHAWRAK